MVLVARGYHEVIEQTPEAQQLWRLEEKGKGTGKQKGKQKGKGWWQFPYGGSKVANKEERRRCWSLIDK